MRIFVYIVAILAFCAAVYAAQAILVATPDAAERLASPYEIEREAARSELLAQGPAAFEQLAPLIESENYGQRKIAAEILAEIAAPQNAEAIAALLAKYPDTPETALPLLQAATRLDTKQAIPQIRKMLGATVAQIRAAAVDALAKFGDAAAIAKIAALLKDDYSEVRLAATNALAALKARDRGAEIFAALQVERTLPAQVAQIAALGELRCVTAEAYLIALLRDADSPLFLPGVEALAAMQTNGARNALIALLMASADFDMLGVAAEAVAAYGESAAVLLDAKLKTASTDDRRKILEAFDRMGPEAIPHLIAFLESETYPLWQGHADRILRGKVKQYYNVDVDWELRHHDPPEKRDAAIRRWREWWEEFSKDKS